MLLLTILSYEFLLLLGSVCQIADYVFYFWLAFFSGVPSVATYFHSPFKVLLPQL